MRLRILYALHKRLLDFEQNNTRVAVFDNTAIIAVKSRSLRVDIAAPTSETSLVIMILEKYIKQVNEN